MLCKPQDSLNPWIDLWGRVKPGVYSRSEKRSRCLSSEIPHEMFHGLAWVSPARRKRSRNVKACEREPRTVLHADACVCHWLPHPADATLPASSEPRSVPLPNRFSSESPAMWPNVRKSLGSGIGCWGKEQGIGHDGRAARQLWRGYQLPCHRCSWPVAISDFIGDLKPDIAVANDGSNSVSVLLGIGSGGFSAPTDFLVEMVPRSVAVGDFNGGMKPDLAVANYDDHSVSVLLNESQ